MMSYQLLPLLLLLTVFACGDSEEEPSSLPVGKDYILTEGKPLYVFQFGGNYSGYRMRIERDTAELFSPFDQHRERMPAYAGDSLSVFSDVQYMVYEMQPDSSLQVVLRDSSGVIGKQRYVLGERLIAHSLDEEVIGRTYRWEIEDTSLLIHFDTSSVVRNGTPEFRVNLFGTDPASGRVSRIASGISNRTDHKSTPLFFPYRPEEAGGRLAVLLITGNDAGEPQTYFTYDQMDQNSLDGPYPLKPVESVLPETVGMAELSHLLNQSFVDIAMLTDEPAAEDLNYAYEEDFVRIGGILADEVKDLDFEFRGDGNYTIFSGDRVIGQGDWTLTRDRNFIKLTDAAYQTSRLQFIDRFDGNSLTLTMPLKIKTREPRGTQLESYYNGVAEVNFRR